MSEFENLLTKLLENRPELSRSEIEDRIKQKKEKIGAGYLTDQGALFLISSDLGVSLSEPLKIAMGLKDIHLGAKEITLETRVLNISPTKQYSQKDGSSLLLRTMTVYDSDSTAKVKLWNEKANLPGIDELRPGDLIRIIKAYVKSDLNGTPTINVGSSSSIETTGSESDIPTIDSITKDVGSTKENEKDLVVSGTMAGNIGTIQFTNSQGKPGKALKFMLKGNNGNLIRVVLWGKDEEDIPKMVLPNAKTRLLGVRTKAGNQGLEIHGNESTTIEVEGKNNYEPIKLRILSRSSDSQNPKIVAIDKSKNFFNVLDSSNTTISITEGEVFECLPSRFHGRTITIDPDTKIQKIENDNNIPTFSDIRTKISDIKVGNEYCVEAIILKTPERREVQTKTGELILLSEMFVEDDTGQIWIKGWREQARLIDKCSIGEIISLTALTARAGLEGNTELFLTSFTTIKKKN